MANASSSESVGDAARQAYWVLRVAFTIVPIIEVQSIKLDSSSPSHDGKPERRSSKVQAAE